MADIVIRGMNMPLNCLDCKIRGDRLTCPILDRYAMNNKTNRRPDCPIVPLPEGHGRLGDLDALMNNIGDVPYKGAVRRVLMSAPTIVPAEGGTENG